MTNSNNTSAKERKQLSEKVVLIAKANNEANKKDTRSITGLINWSKDNEAKVLKELNALNKRYNTDLEPKNINKGLLKFAYLHEVNKVDDSYNIVERKCLFTWSFISKLLKRKAIYKDANCEKFVSMQETHKTNYIARIEAKKQAEDERILSEMISDSQSNAILNEFSKVLEIA